MDRVILAGGVCSDELREATGCALRAELPVRGKPAAQYVADTLREAGGEGRTIVVGYEVADCLTAQSGNGFVQSLGYGLEKVSSETFLLSAADLPFLQASSVSGFLEDCDPKMALNFPIIPIEACARAYPGMKRTSMKVREGRFTGGNIALANTELMRRIFPVLEQAYANRKRPLKLALQVGIGTLLKVVAGQIIPSLLPLATLEKSVAAFLGAHVRAVITEDADIGSDVDNLEQYNQALRILSGSV
ncbi:MAG: NTP transferase domain-containing protein [Armatimonadetes bacterium]|nr:NTP transferase domain-containing protein [Armatimonadota bacterium]